MNIFLLRHAEAVPADPLKYPNDDRPISSRGRRRMLQAARVLPRFMPRPSIIISSPLLRAKDTALMVAQVFKCKKRLKILEFLLPYRTPQESLEYLTTLDDKKSILFVGHEPHLSCLASLLLQTRENTLELKKGSLMCIEVEVPGKQAALLKWLITQKQLRTCIKG